MSTAIVIPWRDPGDPDRLANFTFVHGRLSAAGYRVIVASDGKEKGEPFNKSLAMRAGFAEAQKIGAKVVAFHDADAVAPGLDEAIRLVSKGEAWAAPHTSTYKLTAEASDQVRAGAEPTPDMETYRPVYPAMLGGAVVVLRAEAFVAVPPDPRFDGWGGEDDAWQLALTELVNTPKQVEGPVYLLWHEPPALVYDEVSNVRTGSVENARLVRRYRDAAGNRAKMKEIVKEIGAQI